jgi:hypothetical protein
MMGEIRYLLVESDIKLTSRLIDKINDAKNYDAIVIKGQRPWTEDAMYLKESLRKEIINIPYKVIEDEEILERRERRRPSVPKGLLAIALTFASDPEMMEMLNMSKMIKKIFSYPQIWEPKDRYLAIPKQKFNPRKVVDKRNQIRRR